MIGLFYIVLAIIFLIGTRFTKKEFNKDYISKNTTTIINAVFVTLIFLKHFSGYVEFDNVLDKAASFITLKIDQLVVSTFLFYSGYGILESIKNKKDYMKTFFKKRFVPTFLNFQLAICIFLVMNMILKIPNDPTQILLSMFGLATLGNSTWYMLATFIMYIYIMILFTKMKNGPTPKALRNRCIIFTLLTAVYYVVVGMFKSNYFVNTIFCFSAGMCFSLYKEKIESFVMKDNKNYALSLLDAFLLVVFSALAYLLLEETIFVNAIYNLYAVSFAFFVVILSMKFTLNSKVFTFLGQHAFWIFIIQRAPMIAFHGKVSTTLCYFISLAITLVLSIGLKKITDKAYKKGES